MASEAVAESVVEEKLGIRHCQVERVDGVFGGKGERIHSHLPAAQQLGRGGSRAMVRRGSVVAAME